MCEPICVKFMQRPKVGVENHSLLLIQELSAIGQLMEVRQPSSPLLWSTPGSEDTLTDELGHATVPAYKMGDSVNRFIRLLWR